MLHHGLNSNVWAHGKDLHSGAVEEVVGGLVPTPPHSHRPWYSTICAFGIRYCLKWNLGRFLRVGLS